MKVAAAWQALIEGANVIDVANACGFDIKGGPAEVEVQVDLGGGAMSIGRMWFSYGPQTIQVDPADKFLEWLTEGVKKLIKQRLEKELPK